MLQQFKLYLLVGGLPEAINKFLENRNMAQVRKVHRDIHNLYRIDASQYDAEKKLLIRKIYDMIPSYMEKKLPMPTRARCSRAKAIPMSRSRPS